MTRIVTILGLVLLAAPALAQEKLKTPERYQQLKRCGAQVERAAADLGIDPADVTKASLVPVTQYRGGSEYVTGFEAWLTRTSCGGQVVIQMKTDCAVRGAYGRGNCKMPKK